MRVNIGLRRWPSGHCGWLVFNGTSSNPIEEEKVDGFNDSGRGEPQLLGPVVQVEPHLPIQNRAEVVGVADDEGGPERCRSRNERFLRFFIGGGKNNEMNPEMKKQVPPFSLQYKTEMGRGGARWSCVSSWLRDLGFDSCNLWNFFQKCLPF